MKDTIDPSHIMQVGMGFMASKTLLSAVEMGLFSVLGSGSMSGAQIGDRLNIHPRSLYDFLDALLALGLLGREGDGHDGMYHNTADAKVFLDKASPAYLGGILEMANARLYGFWGNLTTALKTGEPQNEMAQGLGNPFEVLYQDEARLEQFLQAMQGVQLGKFTVLAQTFDFSKYKTFCDVGGANATLAAMIALANPHLACTSFDLPPVGPVAKRHVEAMGAGGRVEVLDGNFFEDDLPTADVITMGNVLHDWDEDQKKMLLRKARASLNDGGMFIAIEGVIDDARRANAAGLLMSLNMLIELPGGFDYTGAQFNAWALEAGFSRTEIRPLAGPSSAAIAFV